MWRTAIPCLVLCTLARAPASLAGGPVKPPAAVPAVAVLRDGVHDFDDAAGAWKEHTTRLKNPLTGSTTWFDMDGYSVVRPLLSGHAQLVEYEGEAPSGHFTLLSVRFYDPEAHQWKINFSTPARGAL